MRIITCNEFGSPDVLKLEETDKPVPEENEILVRVHASSIGYGDLFARNAGNISLSQFNMPSLLYPFVKMSFGLKKPKFTILGAEFAGEIEATGNKVNRLKTGDQVFGYLGMKMGANAEYVCVPEDGILALKPTNMTCEEAATIPYGVLMAMPLLRKVNIQEGQKVLVNGASGGIGSMAVQLSKYFGAEVTGVCSTPKIEYVKSLGADKVIDYTKEDFTENDESYDVIFDVLNKSSFSRCKKLLKTNGTYLLANFKLKQLLQMVWTSFGNNKKVICGLATEKTEDLVFAKELIETGRITTVIDKVYPMEQTAAAHTYIESGQAKAKIVLSM